MQSFTLPPLPQFLSFSSSRAHHSPLRYSPLSSPLSFPVPSSLSAFVTGTTPDAITSSSTSPSSPTPPAPPPALLNPPVPPLPPFCPSSHSTPLPPSPSPACFSAFSRDTVKSTLWPSLLSTSSADSIVSASIAVAELAVLLTCTLLRNPS